MKKLSWAFVGLLPMNMALASLNLELDRAWPSISDPGRMSSGFKRDFASLPLSGSSNDNRKNWSSDYWARKKGGINYRWNSPNPTGFNLKSPTKEQAMTMSESQLAALAPSEKWDLFIGRYDYPTRNEVAKYASPTRPLWEGICDGWAGAALNHHEPVPVTKPNPDGILIPFGSSDIKGLLSWYYAKKYSGGYAMMGRRCNNALFGTDRCNEDMNSGAFHIVLTNRVGLAGDSFIADIDRKKEVWNHLAYNYKTTITSSNLKPRSSSASGTVKVVRVKTSVDWVYNVPRNTWEPVLGTSNQKTIRRTYDYYLDLNKDGRIIGGEWVSSTRPDFLWLEKKVSNFGGLFSKLGELIDDAVVEGEIPETAVDPMIDEMVRTESLAE